MQGMAQLLLYRRVPRNGRDSIYHLAFNCIVPAAGRVATAFVIGHFPRGRYEEAAKAGRRALQCNPGFGVTHSLLAAPLAKLGRRQEAKVVAKQVLALQPSFSASRLCTALALPADLAEALTEAWRGAGMPA